MSPEADVEALQQGLDAIAEACGSGEHTRAFQLLADYDAQLRTTVAAGLLSPDHLHDLQSRTRELLSRLNAERSAIGQELAQRGQAGRAARAYGEGQP